MKISELIALLEESRRESGDLDVRIAIERADGDFRMYPVDRVQTDEKPSIRHAVRETWIVGKVWNRA